MEQPTPQPIDITEYTDYVSYLKDLVAFKKTNGAFSFRLFCQKSGFKSPSYLKWVLDGKRTVALKSVHKFARGLSLNKRETHALQLLVNYREAADPETKAFFLEQIMSRQHKRNGNAHLQDSYEYLSHWYHVAIRELVGAPEFHHDPTWIQRRLCGTISISEIKQALKTLERLGLISQNDQGAWIQQDAALHTGKEVASLAAYNYYSEIFALTKDPLLPLPAHVRELSSTSAMIDRETYDGLKQRMHRFQDEMAAYLQAQEGKRQSKDQELYMLNMQLLPLTRIT